MEETIFDQILKKEIPSEVVFENDKVLGFRDIFPQAKIHLLFIHKERNRNLLEMKENQITDIFNAIKKYAKDSGLDEKGFRVVSNCGAMAGQTVFYTHFHVISGEQLGSFGK